MAVAERKALEAPPDFLLWLNDDVLLADDALSRLLAALASAAGRAVAVGALRDPRSHQLTYSGVRRAGRHPLRFRWIEPQGRPIEVDNLNGNVVLVPIEVARRVGSIDAGFVHSAADFDYGLRARKVGARLMLASGFVGECDREGGRETWLEPSIGPSERWRRLMGPKGLPGGPRARYLKRHGGPFWFLYWLSPYPRALRALVLASLREAGRR